jgi:hypothetical protein
MSIEIPLPIRTPLDGDVTLNVDQRAVALREMQELTFGLGHLHSLLSKNQDVPRDLAYNILWLNQSRNQHLANLLNIELESASEREEQLARMRLLNSRIRELEGELGKSGTIEQTVEHIKTMMKILDAWWDKEGFAHISDVNITKWGNVEITFSCSLFGEFRMISSDTPVSDKVNRAAWHQSIADRGFRLAKEPGERDPVLVDCDQNKEALKNLFANAFPSGTILETTNYANSRMGVMTLRSVKVLVRDMADVLALESRLVPNSVTAE